MNLSRTAKIIITSTIGILVLGLLVWWLWPSTSTQQPSTNGTFGGAPGSRSFGGGTEGGGDTGLGSTASSGKSAKQNIFKISDGPVTGATFIQTHNPTTTLARFVMQTDGHVYDLPLDVPGAIVRLVSNTTIPGTARVLWSEEGSSAIEQYLDGETLKTVYVAFPKTSFGATSTQAQRIRFFPDNILDLALSPDGSQVVYLLPDAKLGSDAFVVRADTTGGQKLFSMPFRQLLVSWPSPPTLLMSTKSVANVAGAIFAVGTKSGAVVPLVYGDGLTAAANSDYSYMLYQKRDSDSSTYVHVFKTGNDYAVPANPDPERCIQGLPSTILYCAIESQAVGGSFLDLWHQGRSTMSVAIARVDLSSTVIQGIATPGRNGGTATDIADMAVSQDGKYLLYVSRGDRSLWGVRLTQ